MKKLLTLAVVLAAFAFAPAAQAHEHEKAVKAEATAEAAAPAKVLSKEDHEACTKESIALKDGKAPTKEEAEVAFKACEKAKLEPVAAEPKKEETK